VAKRRLGPPYGVAGSSKLLAYNQYAALFEFTRALSDSPILVYPQADHSTPWTPFIGFNRLKASRRAFAKRFLHALFSRREQAGLDRRPGTV
jgi:hypothetical protein